MRTSITTNECSWKYSRKRASKILRASERINSSSKAAFTTLFRTFPRAFYLLLVFFDMRWISISVQGRKLLWVGKSAHVWMPWRTSNDISLWNIAWIKIWVKNKLHGKTCVELLGNALNFEADVQFSNVMQIEIECPFKILVVKDLENRR